MSIQNNEILLKPYDVKLSTKEVIYDFLNLSFNERRFLFVNLLIYAALEHLRMQRLLESGVDKVRDSVQNFGHTSYLNVVSKLTSICEP